MSSTRPLGTPRRPALAASSDHCCCGKPLQPYTCAGLPLPVAPARTSRHLLPIPTIVPGAAPVATARTAAAALTMPVPIGCEGATGNGVAVDLSRFSICAGESACVDAERTSATTPATCGAAIEVPFI